MESTSYVLSFQMVFFYLVATGWIFGISLGESSIDQSINQSFKESRSAAQSNFAPNALIVVVVVVAVVSHIQRIIGCQPEKNYFTRWPIPLVVC